jgi:hypothetical protein
VLKKGKSPVIAKAFEPTTFELFKQGFLKAFDAPVGSREGGTSLSTKDRLKKKAGGKTILTMGNQLCFATSPSLLLRVTPHEHSSGNKLY